MAVTLRKSDPQALVALMWYTDQNIARCCPEVVTNNYSAEHEQHVPSAVL